MPRNPQQERGQERVDAILDAAAKLIAEKGVSGLTVHGIAKRAHTSIGSMYHFFPGLDAIIAGLAERHARMIELMNVQVRSTSKASWERMSAAQAADTVVTPLLEYLEANPHIGSPYGVAAYRAKGSKEGARLLAREEEGEVDGADMIEAVIAARNPHLSPELRRTRAALFIVALSGTVNLLRRISMNRALAVCELKRALAVYLDGVG